MKCEVEEDPFQSGGGGFCPGRQEVCHDASQVVNSEVAVGPHLSQINVNKVSGLRGIKGLLVSGYLRVEEFHLLSYDFLPPLIASKNGKQLKNGIKIFTDENPAYFEEKHRDHVYFYSSLKYFRNIVNISVFFLKSITRHELPQNVDYWNVEILTDQDVRTLDDK